MQPNDRPILITTDFYQHYQIITIQRSGFCDKVLVLASEKIRKVVVDAGDIAVTDASDETGEVAEKRGDTLLVVATDACDGD